VRQSQEQDLSLVLKPYLGIAAVLVLIWLLIAFRKMHVHAEEAEVPVLEGNVAGRLWANRHYRYGVMAQFFNVAAQTCVWTFTILYAQDVVGVSAEGSGWYLQASLILFLISRFVMTWLLGLYRPTLLLFIMATFGVICCGVAIFSQNMIGLLAVVAISASLSLMFPTIYGVALRGLGDDAKFGAAGLVMAILGGALLPMVHGVVMDVAGAALGYVVPGVCLAFVAYYAVFDLRHTRSDGEPEPAPVV
jgi:FHS family L-fucose permease-like MFS transporter